MTDQLTAVGRYQLVEIVGQGGMALVYRGYDAELDRPVAIKLLADNLAADDSFRRRFLREARMAGRLAHPNVVQVYDSGEVDRRPYIVMEYVEGETLADLLHRRGRVPPAEAVELVVQVCAGLHHAHGAGLVHRDIKPQNLLLRRDGTVKIADFGIARSAHATKLTEIGSILGTAAYLAPEQAVGETVTPAADLYSVGVVLYQLLTGQTPYTAETLGQLLLLRQEQPIRPVRDVVGTVPTALEDVIMRCLARMPEYRPSSALALAEALASTMPELPTRPLDRRDGHEAASRTARTLATVASLPRRRRAGVWPSVDRRVAAAGAAAIVIALVGLGAIVGRGDSGSPPPPPDQPATTEKAPLEQARDLSAWLRAHSR